jgi:hypothetical protein
MTDPIDFTPLVWKDVDDPIDPADSSDPYLDAPTLNVREAKLNEIVTRVNSLSTTYTLPVIREVISGASPDSDTDGFTLTTSSGVQADDTFILIHSNDWGTDVNMRAPGGTVGAWDLIENTTGSFSYPHIKVWESYAQTAGVKTVTVLPAALGSDDYYATLFVFVGRVTIELSDSVLGSASTSHVAPSLASDGDNRMLLCAFQTLWVSGSGDTLYTGVPSGMTSRSNQHLANSTGAMMTATQTISSAGPTGTKTATYSTSRIYSAVSLLLTVANDPIGNALAEVPSLEELTSSVALGTISATTTYPLAIAMTDMRIPALALISSDITASDTNYWTVSIVRSRAGALVTIATKTTQITAPNGGVTSAIPWSFDLIAFDADYQRLRKDDVLLLIFTPTGTPASWVATVCSWRYEPGVPG